jgi:hypothetical protein
LIPGIVTIIKPSSSPDFLIANTCGIFCSIAFFQLFGN